MTTATAAGDSPTRIIATSTTSATSTPAAEQTNERWTAEKIVAVVVPLIGVVIAAVGVWNTWDHPKSKKLRDDAANMLHYRSREVTRKETLIVSQSTRQGSWSS